MCKEGIIIVKEEQNCKSSDQLNKQLKDFQKGISRNHPTEARYKIMISFHQIIKDELIRDKLSIVKEMYPDSDFYCTFVPNRLLHQKGLIDYEINNLLEETFGKSMHWVLDKYETWNDMAANDDEDKLELARTVDKLVVLDSIDESVAKQIHYTCPRIEFII